jgi:hypothetical protein
MSCTQHGTSNLALGFRTKLTGAPIRSKRTGEPGTQLELQVCPINAGVPSEFGQQSTPRKKHVNSINNLQEQTLQTARQAERHSKWFLFSIY